MTTNIGSKRILELSRDADAGSSATNDAVKAELEGAMKPELLNRIDEVIVFAPLSYQNLKDITSNLIDDARARAADENDLKLTVSDSVAEAITRDGLTMSSQFGARPIRRAVQRYLEDTMAEAIITGFVSEGDDVKVQLEKVASDEKPAMVKITKNFSNGSSAGESISVPVDGVSPSELDLDYLAYGDLPNLDDPPAREPDTFQ
jgi:ATP-dependent Clp protease ATP-binding subunit ClpA